MSSHSVEHVVLFKAKENVDPSRINAWLEALNGLISLDQVLHLSAGPALRIRSSSSLGFTHVLHSRYGSERDLAAYSVHPSHVSVVKDHGQPLIDDIMAVDWMAAAHDLHPSPGSAIRVTFLKLKEDLGDDVKSQILACIRGIKDRLERITQFTSGENFSPGRAKGFSLAWLAAFPGLSELEAMDSNEDLVHLKEYHQKVKDFVESELVVDYVVPLPI